MLKVMKADVRKCADELYRLAKELEDRVRDLTALKDKAEKLHAFTNDEQDVRLIDAEGYIDDAIYEAKAALTGLVYAIDLLRSVDAC